MELQEPHAAPGRRSACLKVERQHRAQGNVRHAGGIAVQPLHQPQRHRERHPGPEDGPAEHGRPAVAARAGEAQGDLGQREGQALILDPLAADQDHGAVARQEERRQEHRPGQARN